VLLNNQSRVGAIQIYESVKEGILYSLPLSWRTPEYTWHSKRGHCGAKAELLAARLREHGYTVRYVVGYRVGGLPRFLRPAFLDCHIWCQVLVDGEWLVLDPTPDRVIAQLCEDTEPGTHQYRPDYIERMDSISPWYKDVYNSPLILPYKLFVNAALTLYRLWKKIRVVNH